MACPVCFNGAGVSDAVRSGMNVGLGVLLAVTVLVLAGFARFIASIVRRANTFDAEHLDA
jgi:hypothetical protein